jgi:hypothetical protein
LSVGTPAVGRTHLLSCELAYNARSIRLRNSCPVGNR